MFSILRAHHESADVSYAEPSSRNRRRIGLKLAWARGTAALDKSPHSAPARERGVARLWAYLRAVLRAALGGLRGA